MKSVVTLFKQKLSHQVMYTFVNFVTNATWFIEECKYYNECCYFLKTLWIMPRHVTVVVRKSAKFVWTLALVYLFIIYVLFHKRNFWRFESSVIWSIVVIRLANLGLSGSASSFSRKFIGGFLESWHIPRLIILFHFIPEMFMHVK